MGIKEILQKAFSKNREYKEMENQYRMQKKFEQKQKNSDERELERFYEEERQKQIKEQLAKFRQQKKAEMWNGGNQLKSKNVIKGKSLGFMSLKSNNLKGGGMFW